MKPASHIIYSGYGACGVIGVGGAASAAVKLGEAVCAFLVGIYVAAFKLVTYRVVGYAVIYIA